MNLSNARPLLSRLARSLVRYWLITLFFMLFAAAYASTSSWTTAVAQSPSQQTVPPFMFLPSIAYSPTTFSAWATSVVFSPNQQTVPPFMFLPSIAYSPTTFSAWATPVVFSPNQQTVPPFMFLPSIAYSPTTFVAWAATVDASPNQQTVPPFTYMPSIFGSLIGPCSPLQYACDFTVAFNGNEGVHDWSPDGSTLAFYEGLDPLEASGVYTMSADGLHSTRLFAMSVVSDLTWSPNGQMLTFAGWDRALQGGADFNLDIYIYDVASRQLTDLTPDETYDQQPFWSPDGTKIAYARSEPNIPSADIYYVPIDGGEPVQLTDNEDSEFGPAWSPDGSKIAYHNTDASPDALFVMNADGSNQRSVSGGVDAIADIFYYFIPQWAPDSNKLFFPAKTGAITDLYSVNADGTQLTKMTDDSATELAPVLSPDGTKLLFASEEVVEVGAPLSTAGEGPENPTVAQDIVTLYHFYVLPVAGGQKAKYDNPLGAYTFPNYTIWLPDGKRISTVLSHDIYLLRVEEE